MDRKEAMNLMEYYVRLRKKLEEDYDVIERRHADLFRQLQMIRLNPSDKEVYLKIEETQEEMLQKYAERKNEQHELLGELEDRMAELIDEIDYGLDVDDYISKYGL